MGPTITNFDDLDLPFEAPMTYREQADILYHYLCLVWIPTAQQTRSNAALRPAKTPEGLIPG